MLTACEQVHGKHGRGGVGGAAREGAARAHERQSGVLLHLQQPWPRHIEGVLKYAETFPQEVRALLLAGCHTSVLVFINVVLPYFLRVHSLFLLLTSYMFTLLLPAGAHHVGVVAGLPRAPRHSPAARPQAVVL